MATTAIADKTAVNTGEELLAAIAAYAPKIAERSAEIEQARAIPADIIAELKRLGRFRAALPRRYGGLDVTLREDMEVVSTIAEADGSTGMVTTLATGCVPLFALLPQATFERIYANGPDVTSAGSFAPKGAAQIVDGGYMLSGRWNFVSGCTFADYLFGTAVVMDKGTPVPSGVGPMPRMLCMVLPREAWTVIDTWHASGMKGTGSNDIAIEDAFVPADQTFSLLIEEPSIVEPHTTGFPAVFSLHFGAMAVGIARGAVKDLKALALSGRKVTFSPMQLKDSPLFQDQFGRAEAAWRAADGYLAHVADQHWQTMEARQLATRAQMVDIAQAVLWVVDTCIKVVDDCFTAAQAAAISEALPLGRRLRDIHALGQHVALTRSGYSDAGGFHLGHPSNLPFALNR